MTIRAPFPWAGGKSRVAHLVWDAFGDVAGYVEPFAGSLAVLLGRPTEPGVETVNDADAYLANFWRALQADPDEVARWADWPVSEADLHARHRWLVGRAEFRERMLTDPDHYDARVAGWWAWGLCSWIGSGWCATGGGRSRQIPHLSGAGQGVHRGGQSAASPSREPRDGDPPLHRKLPAIGDLGRGVHRVGSSRNWHPTAGADESGGGGVLADFRALQARLRRVRVCCGDWTRVLGDSVTWRHGVTGVFLDPPYDDCAWSYATGDASVNTAVRQWAIEHGEHPMLKIALCGYEGQHDMPAPWQCVPWKARGGYGSQRRDGTNENAARERIWFSPGCASARRQAELFGTGA